MQKEINQPIPQKHPVPPFKDPAYTEKFGGFIKGWQWKNKNGEWIYCTAAYVNKEKERTFLKFIYKKNEWKRQVSLKNNILYNIHEIVNNPEKDIVIVENELCIDILLKINKNDFIYTTWTGNVSEIDKTDFSYIKEKKNILFQVRI